MTNSNIAAKRIVFYAVNGIGVGHLTRTVAIARATRLLATELNDVTQIFIVTTSEATHIASADGLLAIKFPSPSVAEACGFEERPYRALGRRWVRDAIEAIQPDLIVVDTFPEGAFGELTEVLGTVKRRVIILRPLSQSYLSERNVFQALETYDLVLVPDAVEHSNMAFPADLATRVRHLGPVLIRHRSELLDRAEARRRLGAYPDQSIVYLTAGGGGDVEAPRLLEAWTDALAGLGALIVVGRGPLRRGVQASPKSTLAPEDWPICVLMNGFDVAVSTAGYNSFNELMHFGVPSIFLPRERRADDQFSRVAIAVERGAALYVRGSDDPTDILPRVRDLLSTRQDSMRQSARALVPHNYAKEFAAALLDCLN